ncbi:MAG: UbiA family prenyltransferase [bacterium]|nr:UbiA family prenyltransferase [bacterium]
MSSRSGLRAGLALTRPRQWPILSTQLAVGVLLAAPAGSPWPAGGPQPGPLAAAWLAWVVLLNGGTLAFNSAHDRDTGPVAYLSRPPVPPRGLASWSLGAMILGAAAGALGVGTMFGLVVAGCLALSVLYSHRRTRWKSRPGLDLAVNVVGYGGGTTLAGLLAGRAAGWAGDSSAGIWFVAAFALLFGSFYPLTQIYQAAADRARGDRTLATALGARRSLVLAMVLALAAGSALALGFRVGGATARTSWPLGAVALWILHLAWWWRQAERYGDVDHERGMYRALGLWAVIDAAVVLAWLV